MITIVTGDITMVAAPATQLAFKDCAPFSKCMTKVDETTIVAAEHLDLVMPMYNLIEYSSNHSETTGNLWFYSKHEAANFDADIVNDNNKFKAKLLGNTAPQPAPNAANWILKNATIHVSLKWLSNFWRSLETSLINCKG